MKKSLKVGVAVVALLAISGTLLAQSYGTSTLQKMKEGVKNFTLSWDLNNGQSGLQSAPLTGKRTGDMLTAAEYNRMLELISEGGGTTVVNSGGTGGNFTTTLFRDITSGGSSKSYTCPAGQFVLSATSILGASGQNSCIIGFSSDKRSITYGGCNVVSGQSWYTDVVCGGGGGDGSGGGSSSWVNVPLSDTSDYDVSCEYRYHIDYTANDLNRLWTNDVRGIVYVQNVGSRYLGVQVVTAAGTSNSVVYYGIPSETKNKYGFRDGSNTFTESTNVTITRLEKRC